MLHKPHFSLCVDHLIIDLLKCLQGALPRTMLWLCILKSLKRLDNNKLHIDNIQSLVHYSQYEIWINTELPDILAHPLSHHLTILPHSSHLPLFPPVIPGTILRTQTSISLGPRSLLFLSRILPSSFCLHRGITGQGARSTLSPAAPYLTVPGQNMLHFCPDMSPGTRNRKSLLKYWTTPCLNACL